MTTDPWEPFKITRSIRQADASEYDIHLLKQDLKTSIIGDISFSIGDDNYTLDRGMLASKSPRFEHLMLSESEDKNEKITELVGSRYSSFQLIVDIIYGIDVKSILNDTNFVNLLIDLAEMELETDLKTFKSFIEKIRPKPELNDRMFTLLNFISSNNPRFNYLLSTVSGYFSEQLLDIYKKEKFRNLSIDEFVFILLHKSDKKSRYTIGRICAEWICHDYQRRIKTVKDLVNATKYRYEIFPYCDWNPNLKTELLQLSESDGPDVQRVEIYFNGLLFSYFGEASLQPPTELKEKLYMMESDCRIIFLNDQILKWTSYLEKGIFCDVAITVQKTIFKLHRIMLSSVSGYFRNLFSNANASLESKIDNSEGKDESKISEHKLNQIDAATFQSVIDYIYKQEIEVTSLTHLINLLKGSKYLKMNDLFEKCFSNLLEIVRNPLVNIFEIFQYVCQHEKYSEAYNVMVKKIIALWPKLDENPEFVDISLDVLKEIVALPDLEIGNTNEIVDLCAKWIFHDIQNRYKYTVEVAKAINRNFLMNSEETKLEIPLNPADFSQLYVEEQLIKILISSALVPLNSNNILDEERRPAFLLLNKDNDLWVVDGKFNEIVQLAKVTGEISRFSATANEDELFILFCIGETFYFQRYLNTTKQMIVLATDARMDPGKKFVILICRNQVYFCNNEILLKYSVEFNRWVTFEVKLEKDEVAEKLYTSDGEKLYKIYSYRVYVSSYDTDEDDSDEWCNENCPNKQKDPNRQVTKVIYYDFEKNDWIPLPDIDNQTTLYKASIIKRELSVLFQSETYSFNWITRNWNKISNGSNTFIEFKDRGQDVIYISKINEVYLYSPALVQWTKDKNLDKIEQVVSIHQIFK